MLPTVPVGASLSLLIHVTDWPTLKAIGALVGLCEDAPETSWTNCFGCTIWNIMIMRSSAREKREQKDQKNEK
jgi:hypothetical protein